MKPNKKKLDSENIDCGLGDGLIKTARDKKDERHIIANNNTLTRTLPCVSQVRSAIETDTGDTEKAGKSTEKCFAHLELIPAGGIGSDISEEAQDVFLEGTIGLES
jgi:hypothetical protein